jgi:MFS transporter, SP family, solute carrier family 2 (myo-inositol transporter), member 13
MPAAPSQLADFGYRVLDTMKDTSSTRLFGTFVLFVAGMGGLLYGIDIGIIAPALLYLGKSVSLTIGQTSYIVAAVLGGSMISSLVAGVLADWLGRKPMMILSGFLFVSSVALIVLSQGFAFLFLGRLLQGLSGGVIAVVVPLYLAESLSASDRGKGAGIFQLMLTVGIVIASLSGVFYTNHAETAIAAAHGDIALIAAAQNHAWRGMFLSVVYPGLIFFAGTFFLTETPRWLFRRGRTDDAYRALCRTSPEAEATLQLREMESVAETESEGKSGFSLALLLQRKYVIPFLLACIILACNQTTGINSILSYLTIILRQAGMSARQATQGDLAVKILNCLMTVVAVALIDRRGRKFLLVVGTTGIIIALSCTAFVFHGFESKRIDIRSQLQPQVQGAELTLADCSGMAKTGSGQPMALSVLYTFGEGDKLATALCGDPAPILHIVSENPADAQTLTIKHAFFGPVPTEKTGWLVAACLALFIASFSVGPGVVVWLALSELMPTRIRSAGMGFALLLNQGTSTLIAGTFLPIVGNHGYGAIFIFWAACTVVYFATAAFFLPETKGKTLEEIEAIFDQPSGKKITA